MTDLEKLIEYVTELYNETPDFLTAHFRHHKFTNPKDGNIYEISMNISKRERGTKKL